MKTIHEKFSDTFLVFQNVVIGNGAINIYGDRDAECSRKMYLLNSELNLHIKSLTFNYYFFLLICRKYMIKRLIHELSHTILDIIPRPISAVACVSC